MDRQLELLFFLFPEAQRLTISMIFFSSRNISVDFFSGVLSLKHKSASRYHVNLQCIHKYGLVWITQRFTPIVRLRQCIKRNIFIFSVQHIIRMCGALDSAYYLS